MSHLPPLDRLTLTPTGEFYPLSRREVRELNRGGGSEALTKEGFRRDTEPWHTFRVKLKLSDGTFKDHFYRGESLWEWYQKSAGGARPPTDPMTRQPVWYEDWWALHDKFDPEGAVPAWAHTLQKLAVVRAGGEEQGRAGGDLRRLWDAAEWLAGEEQGRAGGDLHARAAEWLAGEEERQMLHPVRQNATHWPEELAPPPPPEEPALPLEEPALPPPALPAADPQRVNEYMTRFSGRPESRREHTRGTREVMLDDQSSFDDLAERNEDLVRLRNAHRQATIAEDHYLDMLSLEATHFGSGSGEEGRLRVWLQRVHNARSTRARMLWEREAREAQEAPPESPSDPMGVPVRRPHSWLFTNQEAESIMERAWNLLVNTANPLDTEDMRTARLTVGRLNSTWWEMAHQQHTEGIEYFNVLMDADLEIRRWETDYIVMRMHEWMRVNNWRGAAERPETPTFFHDMIAQFEDMRLIRYIPLRREMPRQLPNEWPDPDRPSLNGPERTARDVDIFRDVLDRQQLKWDSERENRQLSIGKLEALDKSMTEHEQSVRYSLVNLSRRSTTEEMQSWYKRKLSAWNATIRQASVTRQMDLQARRGEPPDPDAARAAAEAAAEAARPASRITAGS
jgi:hypothetical protein